MSRFNQPAGVEEVLWARLSPDDQEFLASPRNKMPADRMNEWARLKIDRAAWRTHSVPLEEDIFHRASVVIEGAGCGD